MFTKIMFFDTRNVFNLAFLNYKFKKLLDPSILRYNGDKKYAVEQ